MRRLRSSGREASQLAAAIRAAARQAARASNVPLELAVRGRAGSVCSPLMYEHLPRICGEAVTNAVRHAKPRWIGVELLYNEVAITLRVSDDGAGFQPEGVKGEKYGRFGLAGMSELSVALGGTLKLTSHVGHGTVVESVVPYR